jgi:hypothetical protein
VTAYQRVLPSVSTAKTLAAKQRGAKTSAIVERFKAWRHSNGLSQRQAALVMQERGVDLPLLTLQKYEIHDRLPGRFAAQAIERFLDEHPVITDAPVLGRWKNQFPDSKVAE